MGRPVLGGGLDPGASPAVEGLARQSVAAGVAETSRTGRDSGRGQRGAVGTALAQAKIASQLSPQAHSVVSWSRPTSAHPGAAEPAWDEPLRPRVCLWTASHRSRLLTVPAEASSSRVAIPGRNIARVPAAFLPACRRTYRRWWRRGRWGRKAVADVPVAAAACLECLRPVRTAGGPQHLQHGLITEVSRGTRPTFDLLPRIASAIFGPRQGRA